MAHPNAGPLPMAGLRYAGSRHVGVLPRGCIQCREGAKLVLFITGLCDKECFYCPVSRDKMYRDVVYANERRVEAGDWGAVIEECEHIGAKGAGITGGDPMVVPHRVEEACKALKARFGPDFHLHLYTSCAFDTSWLATLKAAGLDEIRFHPDVGEYTRMPSSWHHEAIAEALRVGLETSVEIPCIPDKAEQTLALAHYLEGVGVTTLNLNELEFSDPNVANLRRFGYEPATDEDQRVAGSRETAGRILESWRAQREAGAALTIHFCSSPYKDAVQLMQRFRRRAERTMRPFDEQTDEGTLVFGVLRPRDGSSPGLLAERLRDEYEVPPDWLAVIGDRVETAAAVAEELAEAGQFDELGVAGYLSEVHPTSTRVEVERVPLPYRDAGDAAGAA